MRQSTFYLPEGLQAEFKRVAKRRDKSMAEIIRGLVESYVDAHRPPKPRSIGIGTDIEINSTNYREWLKENWHPDRPLSIGMNREADGSLTSDNVDK